MSDLRVYVPGVDEFDRYGYPLAFVAWAAGFFDGEGHIGIYVRRRWPRSVVYVLRASVTQKDRRPLDLLRAQFGGYIARPRHPQDCYRWKLDSRAAERLLRAIVPYAIVKADQIAVALAFMSRRIPVGQACARSQQGAIAQNRVLDPADMARLVALRQAVGQEISREEAMARMDELLALEVRQLDLGVTA